MLMHAVLRWLTIAQGSVWAGDGTFREACVGVVVFAPLLPRDDASRLHRQKVRLSVSTSAPSCLRYALSHSSAHYWILGGLFLAMPIYSPMYSIISPHVLGTRRNDPDFLLAGIALWIVRCPPTIHVDVLT